ncbi:G2/M phase-specific E3 ubiquitin-protein ligase-like [Actinia tenebrosa]|uniref:HECT-type E3 ubiquitin transferase n=1 Tax=Actinia tenebrosa TaxID=6105 RepID=A0A6P8IF37_ACTTE|nr:G2/M phase-specific E3 ubiquitin-protein ligase-like [Actinia tenebrosa]
MCPTCHTSFPLSLIEEHADICCERVARASELAYSNLMLTMEVEDNQDNPAQDVDHMAQEREEEKSELKYIIEKIKGRVSAKSSHIDVQRKFIFDDYLEGRKRPWIKAENRLSVVFIGEAAVDDGGPRREFFTEIFEHVKRRLFIQDDKDGFVPLESTVALTEGSFKVAGELMAMSLAQGGPAPNFLASWVYDYLSSGLDGVPAQIENIKDSKFKRVAEKIMAVETEKDLQEVLTEDDSMDILNEVGYRGVPQREKIKNKDKILRSVYVKVYVEPKIPMLNQMAKGLELYGVLDEITKNKEEMRKVFTFDNFEELTNASLRALWSINFSLPQKLKEDEIITYKAFADFICMVEYEGMSKYEVSLADVLKFITGCTQVPPLGFSKKIAITFVHGCESGCKCRPTASTCALELRLPIHIKSFDDMVSCGVSMLKECFGFGNV